MPVVQLSVYETQVPQITMSRGTSARDEGVLIRGRGNLVHNLHTYAWEKHDDEPFDRVVRFEKPARELVLSGNPPVVRSPC